MSNQLFKDLVADAPLTREGQKLIDIFHELLTIQGRLKKGGPSATAEQFVRARVLRGRLNMLGAHALKMWKNW